MLDAYPELRGIYDENDDNTQVLYFKNATATFSSLSARPRNNIVLINSNDIIIFLYYKQIKRSRTAPLCFRHTKKGRLKNLPDWLGNRDSNPNKQSQSLSCYRYTIPQDLQQCYYISK